MDEPTIQDDIRMVCRMSAIEYFTATDNLRKPLFLSKNEIVDMVNKQIKESYNYSLPLYGFGDIILATMIEECQNSGVNLKIMKD
jgi:hypothetical protein